MGLVGVMRFLRAMIAIAAAAVGARLLGGLTKGYASGGVIGRVGREGECLGCQFPRLQVEKGFEQASQCRVCGCLWLPARKTAMPTRAPMQSTSVH